MALEEEEEALEGNAFGMGASPYQAAAANELKQDTTGGDWGGLLGFLAGLGGAALALPTGGASLASIPALLGTAAAGAEVGSGLGGLADDDPKAMQKVYSGAGALGKSYKDKAFTGEK